MDTDKIEATGLILATLTIISAFMFVTENDFPAFTLAGDNWVRVNISDETGPQVARFMWSYRSLDLIAQALVLFGAAVGCLAILRREEKK